MVFDLVNHKDHLLLGLFEVTGEKGQETIDILQDLFGVVIESVEWLFAESDKLQQNGMQILILDESLMKLIDP